MRQLSRQQIIQRERENPTGVRGGFDGFVAHLANLRQRHMAEWRGGRPNREFDVNDVLAAYGSYPPEEFACPYDLDQAALDGSLSTVQRKYLMRYKNIRRSWSRLLRYLPETMGRGETYKVLEMSTAHGATLEILRHFGHEVTGNDYSNDALHADDQRRTVFRDLGEELLDTTETDRADWPYRPIIESLGLDVVTFDAGITPYPFEDDAFDILTCFDALEHYCHPRDWMKVIDEFARITRQTIVVEINPVRRELIDNLDYMSEVESFYRRMLGYNNAGFRCVGTATSFNQPRFFKLMKIA